MKTVTWLTTITLLLVGVVSAQDSPKADLFLGYSFLRANSARNIPAFTANGGAGTIAWNLNNHIGLEAEFGGYHNGNVHDIEFDTTMMTYLFGPRISLGRSRKIDPYVHMLWGGMHFTSSVDQSQLTIPTQPIAGTPTRFAASQDAFAQAYGGGVDVKLGRSILLRPIQLDWLMSRLQDFGVTGTSENRNQHNIRYAAGIVFNFGAR